MASEFGNKLIVLGHQVADGIISPEKSVELILSDRELQSLSDEQLELLIKESDQYWRKRLEIAIERPDAVAIYAVLNHEVAAARLQSISQFREGLARENKEQLDARVDHWITLETNCLLARALAMLLFPNNKGAWNAFTAAAKHARTLPDLEQPRFREMLWAAYGQAVAAFNGGQQDLMAEAQQTITNIESLYPYASTVFDEIDKEFYRFSVLYQQRLDFLESSAAKPVRNTREMNAPDPYSQELNQITEKVLTGNLTLEAARNILVERVQSIRPGSIAIYYASVSYHNLGQFDLNTALIAADLNLTVAGLVSDGQSDYTRAHCKYVLGTLLIGKAHQQQRIQQPAESLCHQALPLLKESVEYFRSLNDPRDLSMIGTGLNRIAMGYRGVGEFIEAAKVNMQAIQFWQTTLPDASNLGISYGNLADVLERLGEYNDAFENHYKAFQLFLQEQKIRSARDALEYMTELAVQVGRIDDAIAALEQLIEITTDVSDLTSLLQTLISLGEYLFTFGHVDRALPIFERAEDLIGPLVTKSNPEREHLLLAVDIQLWYGTILTLLLDEPSRKFTVEEARDALEIARRNAYEVQDERRYVKIVLQLMSLHYYSRSPENVEYYDRMLSESSLTSAEAGRREEILGINELLKENHIAAIEHLKASLLAYPSNQLVRAIIVWTRLGESYEAIGQYTEAIQAFSRAIQCYEETREGLYENSRIQFAGNADQAYERLVWLQTRSEKFEPANALMWLERSKSRTFTEIIGLSNIPLLDPPVEILPQLSKERELIKRLDNIRNRLFVHPSAQVDDNLPLQSELRNIVDDLQQLWDQIAIYRPEYVELRRGTNLNWEAIRNLI